MLHTHGVRVRLWAVQLLPGPGGYGIPLEIGFQVWVILNKEWDKPGAEGSTVYIY